jgi:class 3 adenylate cyclase
MQYVGDSVMAVFGAPVPTTDHADRALAAATRMHRSQQQVNRSWSEAGLPSFEMGIGLSTGVVAAAMLGSEERAEYTLVGDAVNLCQRLQDLARPGGTIVLSEATWERLLERAGDAEKLEPQLVKGRATAVVAYRIGPPDIEGATR